MNSIWHGTTSLNILRYFARLHSNACVNVPVWVEHQAEQCFDIKDYNLLSQQQFRGHNNSSSVCLFDLLTFVCACS